MKTFNRITPLALAASMLLTSACTPVIKGEIREETADNRTLVAKSKPLPAVMVTSAPAKPTALPRWAETPPLSPGDRLLVDIEDGGNFNGRYEIDIDGAVKLPHLPPIQVAGRDTAYAEKRIADALVRADFFKANRIRTSVRVHEWAHVQVHVSGAVFNPGMVSVNVRNPEERALKSELLTGDFPSERMLTSALRSAGGVRPDAAVDQIKLVRNGKELIISYAGLTQGLSVPPVPLMSGDSIIVPSSGQYNKSLVVPSAITPPGIRVFLSNLTVPANGNAKSAVSKDASSLPYGSRLLTAAVSANCVGGTYLTNASRYTVLVRKDPLTGIEESVERSIHDMIRSPDSDETNPFVMPNDSISCYDSGITNLRDIARTITDIVLPISLL